MKCCLILFVYDLDGSWILIGVCFYIYNRYLQEISDGKVRMLGFLVKEDILGKAVEVQRPWLVGVPQAKLVVEVGEA